jgi:hypothetical protein
MARASYPNTPAGRSRQIRDGDDAYLTGRGHSIRWRRGHGQPWLKGIPGWTGRCERCGDVIRVAALDGGGVRSYEDADGKARSMRKCVKGRRRLWPSASS